MRKWAKTAILCGLLWSTSGATADETRGSGVSFFARDQEGVALSGYDPVSYQQPGGPVAGSTANRFEWSGAIWQFASEANLADFAADPGRYAPRYGGWCAWAVSRGYLQPSHPLAYTLVNGHLYLNWSAGVKRRWEATRAVNIISADRRWPTLAQSLIGDGEADGAP